jgi:hypothetical protein
MSFKISDIEYTKGTDRNPDAMGYIEGYTSNTAGATFLRINAKNLIDEEKIDWYKRLYKGLPITSDIDMETCNSYLREVKVGDIIGEGVRLNRKQVIRLIFELTKWAIRGY